MPPVCEGEYMGMYIGCDWICISALWGGWVCTQPYKGEYEHKSEEMRHVSYLPGPSMSSVRSFGKHLMI